MQLVIRAVRKWPACHFLVHLLQGVTSKERILVKWRDASFPHCCISYNTAPGLGLLRTVVVAVLRQY